MLAGIKVKSMLVETAPALLQSNNAILLLNISVSHKIYTAKIFKVTGVFVILHSRVNYFCRNFGLNNDLVECFTLHQNICKNYEIDPMYTAYYSIELFFIHSFEIYSWLNWYSLQLPSKPIRWVFHCVHTHRIRKMKLHIFSFVDNAWENFLHHHCKFQYVHFS